MKDVKRHQVDAIEIMEKNDAFYVGSEQVAEHFGKRHDNVLRDIRNLIADLPKDWVSLNFEETVILRDNPAENIEGELESPSYLMTRDGFTLLAMGFTGKRALQWKLRYIDAFNAMYTGINEMRERLKMYEEQLGILEKRIMTLAAMPRKVMQEWLPEDGNFKPLMRMDQDDWREQIVLVYAEAFSLMEGIPLRTAMTMLKGHIGCDLKKDTLNALTQESFDEMLDRMKKILFDVWGHGEEVGREECNSLEHIAFMCDSIRYAPEPTRFAMRRKFGFDLECFKGLTRQGAAKIGVLFFSRFINLWDATGVLDALDADLADRPGRYGKKIVSDYIKNYPNIRKRRLK